MKHRREHQARAWTPRAPRRGRRTLPLRLRVPWARPPHEDRSRGDRPRGGLLSSVRVRLTLWYAAILALVLLLCSGAIYATEQQALLAQVDSHVIARLHQLAATYDARSGRITAAPDLATARGDEVVLLLTPQGGIVQTQAAGRLSAVKAPWSQVMRALRATARSGDSSVVEQGFLLSVPAGLTKDGRAATTAIAGIFRLSALSLTVRHQVTALLVVGLRSDVPQQMAALARTLETVVPLTLVLCAGGGYWLASRALRPVQAITRTARQISATDLSQRLNLRRRDELGQLGATFDHMLDRLEAAFERQRQFTADASHELRTPLAIVDLEAARALARPRTPTEYRRAITVMQQENGHMARLVDDLLTLARADSGQAVLRREDVDLAEVVLDVAERLASLARQREMRLCMDALPELHLWGDQGALTRMVMNVVENALAYGADGGTQVRISAGYRRQGGVSGVWLQIADDGPGIAAEHLPHLCERFYRVDQARTRVAGAARENGVINERPTPTSSGLGLAITQWIVRAHGGHLRIQSERDHGVVVHIWLPEGAAREARWEAQPKP